MNSKVLKLLVHGFWRRRKEIMRACIATFFAIFFISGVLLFQENMYQWQMAQNRKQFGDWFAIENYAQTVGVKDQPYLTDAATAQTFAMIFDQDWKKTKVNVGTMSDEFMERGNITLADGRLPANDTEIAMDYNTLSKLGYSAELGQDITFNYLLNDKVSSSDSPKRNITYKLCGVFNNFTDSWSVMKYIPGAVVSEKGARWIQADGYTVYMYGLLDSYRTSDYQPIYDQLSSYNSKKIFYNKDVYDFQPWGPKAIYNYIYLLVMVIGIAALTYQIISYQYSRTSEFKKLYRLGASKKGIFSCRTLENILILLPSGALGILGAFLAGQLIGFSLQAKYGIAFYHITIAVILKAVLSLLAAFLVSEIVNVIMNRGSHIDWMGSQTRVKTREKHAKKLEKKASKKSSHKEDKEYGVKLKKNNIVFQMQHRLSRGNGVAMNLGVRVFSLAIALVILFCGYNLYDAIKVYKKYESKSDICGFQQQDGSVQTYLNVPFDTTNKEEHVESVYPKGTLDYYQENKRSQLTLEEYLEFQRNAYEGEKAKEISFVDDLDQGIMDVGLADSYLKLGNSTIIQGLDDTFVNAIENTTGVKKAYYSCFETARDWEWDAMDLTKMGVSKLKTQGSKVAGYSDTYMFATEYVDPTEDIYKRISQYMDPSMVDYEAFKEGKQVIVFEQKNVGSFYDHTLEAGTELKFHYYLLPIAMKYVNYKSYNFDIEQFMNSPFPYWNTFGQLYYNKYAAFTTKFDLYNQGFFYTYYPGSETEISKNLLTNYYKMKYEPCVTSNVAAVVAVDDDVKEAFSDIIPDFAYYTAIASSNLGKKAVDNQNQLMKDMLGSEYTDELNYEFANNQVTLTYDLTASYSSTDNIVSAYFSANNVISKSSASQKESYRTSALDAILQYGITMLAAIVIDLLIYSILTRNRMELRREKLKLLARLGTPKSRIRKICMLEIFRESLWCIFTAPLLWIVQYAICRGSVRKL